MKRSNSSNTLRDGLDVDQLRAMVISFSDATGNNNTIISPIPDQMPAEEALILSSSSSNATPPTTNNGPNPSSFISNTSFSSGTVNMPPNTPPSSLTQELILL